YEAEECRCRKCVRWAKRREEGRTSLAEAIHEAAAERLERRRKNFRPVWQTPKKKRKNKHQGDSGPAGAAAAGAEGPAGSPPTGPGSAGGGARWDAAWKRARDKARSHAPGAGFTVGPDGTTGTGTGAGPRRTPWQAAGMASAAPEVITVERT